LRAAAAQERGRGQGPAGRAARARAPRVGAAAVGGAPRARSAAGARTAGLVPGPARRLPRAAPRADLLPRRERDRSHGGGAPAPLRAEGAGPGPGRRCRRALPGRRLPRLSGLSRAPSPLPALGVTPSGMGNIKLAGAAPFGMGAEKPHHYLEMAETAWRNRDKWGYAWRILNDGVCDGCALGTSGLSDWTLDGVHLCLVRLNLLELN